MLGPSSQDETPVQTTEGQTSQGGWGLGLLLAFSTLLVTLWTIGDPGLTVDEPINVGHGVQMVSLLFHRPTALADYQQGQPDHPPLTRILIGLSHALCAGKVGDGEVVPNFGRPASAIAFALLVLLCTRYGCILGGQIAGIASGVSLVLMPRLFAHAHLASPEMISTALCFAAMQAAVWAFASDEARLVRRISRILLAGFVLGLALLTKLTAVLVPLGIWLAVIWQYRHRRLAELFLWSLIGGLVFIAGWPWLWPTAAHGGIWGTFQRLGQFLSVGIDRATIYTWYFGKQYPNADAGVPWHYTWVYFAVTVPVILQFSGILAGLPRLWALRHRWHALVVAVSLMTVLLFFTLPLDRYDGERLFLLAFPLWAVIIGVGFAAGFHWMRERLKLAPWLAGVITTALLLSQSYGVLHYHPCQLSYYNLAVGGLAGAESLGLEATYWGDSLTDRFLDQFAQAVSVDDCAQLKPTLYAGHAYLLSSPEMARKQVRILPEAPTSDCQWIVMFHRQSYLQDELSQQLLQQDPVLEYAVDGVWLSRVYRVQKETAVAGSNIDAFDRQAAGSVGEVLIDPTGSHRLSNRNGF